MTYLCGVYNADNHRPDGPEDIARLVKAHHLDLLAVVEANGYRRDTADLLPHHRVRGAGLTDAARDSMIVVRNGIYVDRERVHNLRTGPWERKTPGLHPGRKMRSIRVGEPGRRFRFAALHMPPPPHDARQVPLRGTAFRRGLGSTATIVRRWENQALTGWVIGGDWNATHQRRDVQTWLAMVDGDAAGAGIDWPAWSGVLVTDVHRVPAGGDHGHAMLFRVHV